MAHETQFTPGPWPFEYTGDGKRIVIGKGLVEGPNGYEVAEVYSDDCDQAVAEANARLIAAAPDQHEALADLVDQDLSYQGDCIVIRCKSHGDAMARVRAARAALAKARSQANRQEAV